MADPTVRFTNNGDWLLPNDQRLEAGDYLVSRNGRFRLTMTDDHQLFLFEDGNHIWTADEKQPHSLMLKLQKKKNELRPYFYISNSGFLVDTSRYRQRIAESSHSKDKSVWSNTHLLLQDDGNIVIADMRRVWPRMDYPFQPNVLNPIPVPRGEFLEVGHVYAGRNHRMILQEDGNLVIYTHDMVSTWQSATNTAGGAKAIMQNDGNFVVYDHSDKVLWQTGTGGDASASPYVQPDGQLMMMREIPVWARVGFQPGRTYRKKIYLERNFGDEEAKGNKGHTWNNVFDWP